VASDRVSHRARRATTTRARAFECRLHRFPNHRQTETVGLVVAPRGAMRADADADADARARARDRSRRRRLAFERASSTERPPRAASCHRGARVARASLPLVALVALVVSVALARALASVSSRARGFSGFFRAIDGDGDGELTTRELRRYFDGVGGRDLDERREVARAARATVETMDTEDEGTTVNLRELRRAARGMANARDVGEWVGRGVGYPEYAEAFVESRITLLDFPQLLARDGDGLRRMGVYKSIHRQALMRAMKRQLLLVGRKPSAPRRASARKLEGDGEAVVRVSWIRPRDLGSPEVHEYVIQSGVGVGGRVFKWTDVGSVGAKKFVFDVEGLSRAPGLRHTFRVVAWSEFGHSDLSKGTSNWISMVEDADAKGWMGKIVSLAFGFRLALSLRVLVIRGARVAFGVVKLVCVRARGERVGFNDVFKVSEPSSPVSSDIRDEGLVFTPTKALESQSSVSVSEDEDSTLYRPMRELKERARSHLSEPEFATGAGGSDGFSPQHRELALKHSRESMRRTAKEEHSSHFGRSMSLHSCEHAGCSVAWSDVTRSVKVIRHFCGLCQSWYCAKHTLVSPHGNRGRCRPESRCVCHDCYKSLTKEQQKELDKDNAYSLTAPKMKRSTTLWSRVKTTKRSDKSTNARIANLENNLVARSRWMRGGSTSMSESERSALF